MSFALFHQHFVRWFFVLLCLLWWWCPSLVLFVALKAFECEWNCVCTLCMLRERNNQWRDEKHWCFVCFCVYVSRPIKLFHKDFSELLYRYASIRQFSYAFYCCTSCCVCVVSLQEGSLYAKSLFPLYVIYNWTLKGWLIWRIVRKEIAKFVRNSNINLNFVVFVIILVVRKCWSFNLIVQPSVNWQGL